MKDETKNSSHHKKSVLFWFLAILLTIGLAVYQRLTGPTYPVKGQVSFLGEKVSYKLPRSAENQVDCPVVVNLPASLIGQVQGYLRFRRPGGDKPWNILAMQADGQQLKGFLPKQPPAGRIEYFVHLVRDSQEISLTGDRPVVIRFKGQVSMPVLLAHILVMFLGMLFSMRAGLAALNPAEKTGRYAKWAAAMIFFGGFIFGPIIQKMAFGYFWTGFPLGKDLTDTKTLIIMIGWLAALLSGRKTEPKRSWVLAASLLTLVLYLIPHSLLGS
ncbi:MAG TPA: hypothetical protein PKZ60_00940 [Candidatus Saccharicenans sp.]|nr:hypothetical protein [Candidatus Saccharicenans sp.]HPU92884.1 hypothetical protein [Candidatus Saccharicenans sp.]